QRRVRGRELGQKAQRARIVVGGAGGVIEALLAQGANLGQKQRLAAIVGQRFQRRLAQPDQFGERAPLFVQALERGQRRQIPRHALEDLAIGARGVLGAQQFVVVDLRDRVEQKRHLLGRFGQRRLVAVHLDELVPARALAINAPQRAQRGQKSRL